MTEEFPWVTVYNYAENEPVGHVDLWGLQKEEAPLPGMSLPTATVTAPHPTRWMQTGTGYGLSVGTPYKSQFTMDVEKIFSTPLIVATAIPAIPVMVNVAGTGGILSNPIGLNSVRNGLWSAGGDFGAQMIQREFRIGDVNFFSVASNAFLKNPLSSNLLGSAFSIDLGGNVGFTSYSETIAGTFGGLIGDKLTGTLAGPAKGFFNYPLSTNQIPGFGDFTGQLQSTVVGKGAGLTLTQDMLKMFDAKEGASSK